MKKTSSESSACNRGLTLGLYSAGWVEHVLRLKRKLNSLIQRTLVILHLAQLTLELLSELQYTFIYLILEKTWPNSKRLQTSMMFKSGVLMANTLKPMTLFSIFQIKEDSDVLKKILSKTCTTESKLWLRLKRHSAQDPKLLNQPNAVHTLKRKVTSLVFLFSQQAPRVFSVNTLLKKFGSNLKTPKMMQVFHSDWLSYQDVKTQIPASVAMQVVIVHIPLLLHFSTK